MNGHRHVLKKLRGTALFVLGYMLSPLSWWNDLFFNFPIAYAFGFLVGQVYHDWFLPGVVVGYWLSNVLGFVLMQTGAGDALFQNASRTPRKDLLISLGTSTLYTAIVITLWQLDLVDTPKFLTAQFLQP